MTEIEQEVFELDADQLEALAEEAEQNARVNAAEEQLLEEREAKRYELVSRMGHKA